MAEFLALRRRIAGELLGSIDEAGYCVCPGKIHHSHRNGKRDCRVRFDGAPTVFCVHNSCAGTIEEINHTLRSRIATAERAIERGDTPHNPRPSGYEGCAAKPQPPTAPKVPPFDPDKLARFAGQCRREITLDWISELSPVMVPTAAEQRKDGRPASLLFLNTLYRPDDRVLIFTRFFSSGDFLHVAGRESYRLAEKPGVRAAPSVLPMGAKEGVWFLTAPVTGEWKPKSDPDPSLSRRHEACVTRFPYLLLESDTANESQWLKALVQLPLAITALYTSGGVSVHALVRVDCESKADFDAAREVARAVLCPLGADGAAMTAVRLSRLPGCMRHGKQEQDGYRRYDSPRLQRLVFLDPSPPRDSCLLDRLK